MKKYFVLGLVLLLAACNPQTEQVQLVAGPTGTPGAPGADGYTTYITTEALQPSEEGGCRAGGIQLIPYTDRNRNASYDVGEATVGAIATICNGLNGLNGAQGAQGIQGETGEMGPIGPQGVQGIQGIQGLQGVAGPQGDQGLQGVKGDKGDTGATGAIGATGPQGQPGIQGLQGIAGANGSNGSFYAIQLCPGDNAAFPEQGFVMNGSLYAVYYGVVNGSLNAFLARLSAGNYVTTNGTSCHFSVSYSGNNVYINNVLLVDPNSAQGLACNVYDSRSIDRSSGMRTILTNAVPKFSIVLNQLNVSDTQASAGFPQFSSAQKALIGTEDYALDCSGFINIPKSQSYVFKVLSDDGSQLYINNNLLINMDQLQSPTTGTSASTYLLKGLNKINVLYYQGPQSQIALKLDWSAPEFSQQLVPASVLSY